MASEQQEKAAQRPQMVVIDTQQHAARELAAELDELRKGGKQLDKTIPGGRYANAGGEGFHDAFGNPISEDGGAPKGSKGVNVTKPEDISARLREIEEERNRLIAQQQVVSAQAQAEAAGGAAEDDDEPKRGAAAKKSTKGR